ncbi:MAG: hypothetical protein ACREC9_00335 [Methylocella sp.]
MLRHGGNSNLAAAAAAALPAGVGIDTMNDDYSQGLPEAIARGLVSTGRVDAAVRRALKLKEHLGLFDDSYWRGPAVTAAAAAAKVRIELARAGSIRNSAGLPRREAPEQEA